MILPQSTTALKIQAHLTLRTPLLVRAGVAGDFADAVIERDPNGQLHINGYVWASLLRRALARLEEGSHLAAAIGDYGTATSSTGVSPLWCEASFAELPRVDIRPQNRMDRQLQTVASGALYSQEVVPPGLPLTLRAIYFLTPNDISGADFTDALAAALWVINEGVETVGGGWSYGCGQLDVARLHVAGLNLTQAEQRQQLWEWDATNWSEVPVQRRGKFQQVASNAIWHRLRLHGAIPDGQLLAVSESLPPLELAEYADSDMPDSFVFRRTRFSENNTPQPEIVIPGKALRQAVLSRELERAWRTAGQTVCLDSTAPSSATCTCQRCRWFGNTSRRGCIAVADAPVTRAERTNLHRISLCEHSFQNINLFSGEYLSRGEFTFEVLVDGASSGDTAARDTADEILKSLKPLLAQMQPDGPAPPGWYRLGKTSTATGQLEFNRLEIRDAAGEWNSLL